MLTPEEIKTVAKEIPAPVPVPEKADESGGIRMGFTKPIAVPTPKKKTEMVSLLLENDMIEMNLTTSTGKIVKGEPFFDEAAFAKQANAGRTFRMLKETDD